MLRDEGWPDRTIRRRVDRREWARPRPGAYVDGQVWARLSESQRHEVVTRAAIRQSKVSVLASHVSAVVLEPRQLHLARIEPPRRTPAHVVVNDVLHRRLARIARTLGVQPTRVA